MSIDPTNLCLWFQKVAKDPKKVQYITIGEYAILISHSYLCDACYKLVDKVIEENPPELEKYRIGDDFFGEN